MPLLDHFGLIAPVYDKIIHIRDAEQLAQLLALPGQPANQNHKHLLDAGGGTGRVSGALQGIYCSKVVLDESMGMLRQARQKKRLEAVCSQAERLPFPDGAFDRIIMVDALHHVASQERTASELWRVLRPGGRLVIEEPDIRTMIVKLVAIVERISLMRSRFIPPKDIAKLFPEGVVKVYRESYNTYIVVDKT
jgi:demethylmenaquinone methyltransferase/2-methoxy-6-polyprenyl-1,4-benzoquinol methylase